jgi:hypothetical protein
VRLFINHEGSQRSWSKLRVVGESPNRFAYGAIVDVRVGQLWQTRQVLGAGGFKSHDELTLHLGLADAQVMDEIRVQWPDGAARTLANYPAQVTWSLYPPDRLGDFDGDDRLAFYDLVRMRQCLMLHPGTLEPGCELGDFDGDAALTSVDWQLFLDRFFS